MVKKQRNFYMDDDDFKKLKSKVSKLYSGKGALERYLEDIARNNVMIMKGEEVKNKTLLFL